MNILKRGLPEKIIRKISRHPVLAVSTISLAMRVGKDALRMKEGEIDRNEFQKRTGSHVGAMSGGLGGAMLGMAVGSVAPGLTIVGAFAGGMVGEELGGKAGRKAVEAVGSLLGIVPSEPEAQTSTKSESTDDESQDQAEPSKREL